MRKLIFKSLLVMAACAVAALLLTGVNRYLQRDLPVQSSFPALPADTSRLDEALDGLNEDFTANERFVTSLPIVVLDLDAEPQVYKHFQGGQELIVEDVEPYVTGSMRVISGSEGGNRLSDAPALETKLRLKLRGHSSMSYDKVQYRIKALDDQGLDRMVDVLGMGAHDEWVLNGSMADKSMLRNYLGYRIASEIRPETPDCRYCEVFLQSGDTYTYQGVYLMMENISRGETRVNIDESKRKNIYTSYIVRRDRFTNYDAMLDTYGRLNGLNDGWIGVKYPPAAKQTEQNLAYIAQDFSQVEHVIYSEDEAIFKAYDRYIDVDSFVDYFLINEFFGNYDSGLHSTYMYKNSGDKLCIGPVWDFDQAMNNSVETEADPLYMAMQTRTFFAELTKDVRFLDLLRNRYLELRRSTLSEAHVLEVIDEAVDYLRCAQRREWFRWAADYLDGSGENWHNYTLQPYLLDDLTVPRFNTNYQQELYTIRVYLREHGDAIPLEINKLYDSTEFNTGLGGQNAIFLAIVIMLFLAPSLIINRR